MTTANDPWGRVADDGTVYVRTADGERVIGSWAAGSPEEALAFFRRKYQSLETEVALIEQRMAATEIAPAQAQATVQRLLHTVADANCIGDLDSLRVRLEGLTTAVDQRREEVKAAREHQRQEAREIKERIVAEAEQIAAEATHWKASGERMAELLEEWKAAPHADRSIEAVLWKRLSAARNGFTKRRKAYFASLESEREAVRARKEKLVEEAEALADSTDWGATSSVYRDLMRQWKEAGRAGRDDEAELWKRFRDAQDKFFAARSEVFAAKETELRGHATLKEQLLAEAQGLLPITDWRAARSTLRGIQERWEQAGPVPRESRDQLEQGLRRVEEAVRRAEENQWKRSNPEAVARAEGTVNQLRAAIATLESQLAKAQARGDASGVSKAEEALA
ncbi:MAG TPA: DUF349 domain-containing protein, partial [Trebonia sp.]|nr:DUF349 domain-containing protein [Trebonia sp.]